MFKRKNKSKKELVKNLEDQKEVLREREFIKTQFYPLLTEYSENINDAMVFCQAISVAIKQAFNNQMLTTKVSDLKLNDMLDKNGPLYAKYHAALMLFNDETITNALRMIDGMPNAIESFLREENSKRPLLDLKTDFL